MKRGWVLILIAANLLALAALVFAYPHLMVSPGALVRGHAELRQHPRIGNLPVILMTGKSAPHDVVKGLAAGANGYVSKPFKMSALVKAVNEVLGNA